MPPSSRKRRNQDDEDKELSSCIIPPTPGISRRNGGKAASKTPAAAPSLTSAAAVIPASVDQAVAVGSDVDTSLVTPHGHQKRAARKLNNPNARRALRLDNNTPPQESAQPVTPSHPPKKRAKTVTPPEGEKAAKRRLIFGKLVEEIKTQPNTKRVYALVKKLTGSLGGNGSCGPIYGELTQGSMQKMVNLMRQHTQFDHQSRFIDVGSGIGKPNLHVTQDPGVAFSCGIEMELDRYRLGLKCLQSVLHEAVNDSTDESPENKIRHQCMFLHGNIMEARTFDPFTHVYMFSIGFPPKLWVHLAEAWNRSKSPFLICYHGPRTIINDYEFEVELLAQMPTSMHASGEGHTGYIYQRQGLTQKDIDTYIAKAKCDKVFKEAYQQVQSGLGPLLQAVDRTVSENWTSRGRSMTRSEARKHGVVLSK